jgi:hypothetical protein
MWKISCKGMVVFIFMDVTFNIVLGQFVTTIYAKLIVHLSLLK